MTDFPPPKFIDDVTLRDTWVETVQVLHGPPGSASIKIEFCVYRWTTEPPIHCDRITPVARVAMSAGLAEVLRDHLTSTLEAAKQAAALQQAPPASQLKN